MKLRKPCEHGFYDGHLFHRWGTHPTSCPGGVFLPDDTLIIETEEIDGHRFWPVWACRILDYDVASLAEVGSAEILDALQAGALSVREAE